MDSQIKRRRCGVNSLAGWQEEIRRCPLPFYSVLSLKQKGKKNLSSCRRPLQKNRSKSNISLGVINLVFMSFAMRRETWLTVAKLIHLTLHSEIETKLFPSRCFVHSSSKVCPHHALPYRRNTSVSGVRSFATAVETRRLISSWFGSVGFKFLEEERKKKKSWEADRSSRC